MTSDTGARAGDLDERAEVAVIGTGAGGAVMAALLAEAGVDVAVLEEGDHDPREKRTGEPLAATQRLYRDGGLTGAIGNGFIPIPLGRAVGGTTLINSGTCWRTPDEVLERWQRDFGIPDLAGAGLAAEYEEVEKAIGVAPVPEELLGPGALLVRRGARALGWHTEPIPRNAVACRGTGACPFGCPRDAKQSTNVSYVPRALAAGARLHVRARVERIRVENGRAVGVHATRLDPRGRPVGTLRIRTDRVVVAAGALLTPGLLARSGLARFRSEIGRNLRIHPASRVVARFDEPVRSWEGVPQSLQVRDFESEGIFLQGIWVPPEILAATLPGLGMIHKERMANVERLASFGALISDSSAGRVLSFAGRSLVWYRMNRKDVARMRRAVSCIARIYFAAGAREVYPGVRQRSVLHSMEEAEALEQLPLRAADFDLMAFHPMGTARMGGDPARSAVDPEGRLRGVSGVSVADASLFPTSTRINPQLTIMALATRIARSMVARRGP